MNKFRVFIEKYLFLIAIFIVGLSIYPYIFFNQNVVVRIHDNLDSNIVWYIIADNNSIFKPSSFMIENIMGGIERGFLGSEFYFFQILFAIFPPFIAYVINETIIHFVAFFGMYFLLKTLIFKNLETFQEKLILIGIAICFSLLPFWSPGGLSVAGQPLALYCFIKIRNKEDIIYHWIFLALIPFFVIFTLSFAFFIPIIGLIWLYDGIFQKHWNFRFLISIIMVSIIFLGVEYRLILVMFFNILQPSHRNEFSYSGLNFTESITVFFNFLVDSQDHVSTLHKYIIIPIVILSLGTIIAKICIGISKNKKSENGESNKIQLSHEEKFFLLLIFIELIIALIFCIWSSNFMSDLRKNSDLLSSFNFSRFYFLNPLCWYLLLGASYPVIKSSCLTNSVLKIKKIKKNKEILTLVLVLGLLISQIGIVLVKSPTYKGVAKQIVGRYNLTYEQYYAEEQYNQIKEDINLSPESYRIASLGLDPAVSLYNGFYTIDGYLSNYPLEYKHEFQKIIQPELDKSEKWKDYYENWGSRCYIFSSELDELYYIKFESKIIQNLELNITQMKNLGCDYIFSAFIIENSNELNIELLHQYSSTSSAWNVFLYEL